MSSKPLVKFCEALILMGMKWAVGISPSECYQQKRCYVGGGNCLERKRLILTGKTKQAKLSFLKRYSRGERIFSEIPALMRRYILHVIALLIVVTQTELLEKLKKSASRWKIRCSRCKITVGIIIYIAKKMASWRFVWRYLIITY